MQRRRVRRKCGTDKSPAVAHGLEYLYVAHKANPKMARDKKKGV